jgi:hypothetical protein
MMMLMIIHILLISMLLLTLFSTILNLASFSCCGRANEFALLVYLGANIIELLIYYSNYKYSESPMSDAPKKARLLFFILLVFSPVMFVGHMIPNVFCGTQTVQMHKIYYSITMFLSVNIAVESIFGTCYFIHFDKHRLHRELMSRPYETSLKL